MEDLWDFDIIKGNATYCRSGGLELDDLLRDLGTPTAKRSILLQDQKPAGRDELADLLQDLNPDPRRADRHSRMGLRKEDRTPSPCRDCREPVVDDYDVVKAIADFAKNRPGDQLAQEQEDVGDLIQLLTWQVQALSGQTATRASSPEKTAPYQRARAKLLMRLDELAEKRKQLDHHMDMKLPEPTRPAERLRSTMDEMHQMSHSNVTK